MADIFEMMENDKLNLSGVFNEAITQVVSNLYIYVEMLPKEREKEVNIINDLRSDLVRIRGRLTDHLDKGAK